MSLLLCGTLSPWSNIVVHAGRPVARRCLFVGLASTNFSRPSFHIPPSFLVPPSAFDAFAPAVRHPPISEHHHLQTLLAIRPTPLSRHVDGVDGLTSSSSICLRFLFSANDLARYLLRTRVSFLFFFLFLATYSPPHFLMISYIYITGADVLIITFSWVLQTLTHAHLTLFLFLYSFLLLLA